MADNEQPHRWRAEVEHRDTPTTTQVNTYFVEEIDELQDIIEQGPHWGTIVSIQVYLNRKVEGQSDAPFSQEDALKL